MSPMTRLMGIEGRTVSNCTLKKITMAYNLFVRHHAGCLGEVVQNQSDELVIF